MGKTVNKADYDNDPEVSGTKSKSSSTDAGTGNGKSKSAKSINFKKSTLKTSISIGNNGRSSYPSQPSLRPGGCPAQQPIIICYPPYLPQQAYGSYPQNQNICSIAGQQPNQLQNNLSMSRFTLDNNANSSFPSNLSRSSLSRPDVAKVGAGFICPYPPPQQNQWSPQPNGMCCKVCYNGPQQNSCCKPMCCPPQQREKHTQTTGGTVKFRTGNGSQPCVPPPFPDLPRQGYSLAIPKTPPPVYANNISRGQCSCGPSCNSNNSNTCKNICILNADEDEDDMSAYPCPTFVEQPCIIIKTPRRRGSKSSCCRKQFMPPTCGCDSSEFRGYSRPPLGEYHKPRPCECCCCSKPKSRRRPSCKIRRCGLHMQGTGLSCCFPSVTKLECRRELNTPDARPFNDKDVCIMQQNQKQCCSLREGTSARVILKPGELLNVNQANRGVDYFPNTQMASPKLPYDLQPMHDAGNLAQPFLRIVQDRGSSVVELTNKCPPSAATDEGCLVNMVSPVVSTTDVACKGIQSNDTDSDCSESSSQGFNDKSKPQTRKIYPTGSTGTTFGSTTRSAQEAGYTNRQKKRSR